MQYIYFLICDVFFFFNFMIKSKIKYFCLLSKFLQDKLQLTEQLNSKAIFVPTTKKTNQQQKHAGGKLLILCCLYIKI